MGSPPGAILEGFSFGEGILVKRLTEQEHLNPTFVGHLIRDMQTDIRRLEHKLERREADSKRWRKTMILIGRLKRKVASLEQHRVDLCKALSVHVTQKIRDNEQS